MDNKKISEEVRFKVRRSMGIQGVTTRVFLENLMQECGVSDIESNSSVSLLKGSISIDSDGNISYVNVTEWSKGFEKERFADPDAHYPCVFHISDSSNFNLSDVKYYLKMSERASRPLCFVYPKRKGSVKNKIKLDDILVTIPAEFFIELVSLYKKAIWDNYVEGIKAKD